MQRKLKGMECQMIVRRATLEDLHPLAVLFDEYSAFKFFIGSPQTSIRESIKQCVMI